MIEQLTILANRLDAFDLPKEADRIDKISQRLIRLEKTSHLLTKEASSVYESLAEKYLSAAVEIYCIASSVNESSITKEANDIADKIFKNAFVNTFMKGLGDLALSPLRGLWERGQYVQMQSSMTSLINSLQNTLKSLDKNNQEACQQALQTISQQADSIKNQFSNYAAKARKNPALFYMSRAISLAVFEWENRANQFPSPYEAIRGLYMILFQVWQNIKVQMDSSNENAGDSSLETQENLHGNNAATGNIGGPSSEKSPENTAQPLNQGAGGKFNLEASLEVAHSIRNHAYVASMFKTVVSLYAKQKGFSNWSQVPDNIKKVLWAETKKYWEKKEKRPWNSLAHLRGRFDNQSLKRMTAQLQKLQERYKS